MVSDERNPGAPPVQSCDPLIARFPVGRSPPARLEYGGNLLDSHVTSIWIYREENLCVFGQIV